MDFIVLEGNDRVGGRMRKAQMGSGRNKIFVEEGASVEIKLVRQLGPGPLGNTAT